MARPGTGFFQVLACERDCGGTSSTQVNLRQSHESRQRKITLQHSYSILSILFRDSKNTSEQQSTAAPPETSSNGAVRQSHQPGSEKATSAGLELLPSASERPPLLLQCSPCRHTTSPSAAMTRPSASSPSPRSRYHGAHPYLSSYLTEYGGRSALPGHIYDRCKPLHPR